MANVSSNEELSADDRSRGIFEPLNRRSWLFYRRRISQVEPMEPTGFFRLFRCLLNYIRQARISHHNVSYHLLMLFKWHLDVMVHHGEHVGITSDLLAEGCLIIALRRYEKWVKEDHDWSSVSAQWDVVRGAACHMKRRLLKMSRGNSRAGKDE